MSADNLDADAAPNAGEPVNPYLTPEAVVESTTPVAIAFVKATRAQRLGAFIIDALIGSVPFLVMWLTALYTESHSTSEAAIAIAFAGFGVAIMLASIVVVIQLVLLYRDSWTVGKRVLGIKIVRANGEPAGLSRIVFLRTLLPGVFSIFPLCCFPVFLASFGRILSFAPSVILLIDPLFMLGREQRCVHDYVADTIVVKA